MKTRTAFCAIEQLETEHVVTIDKNGEYLFTCPCGAFFKFPADFTKDDIDAHLVLEEVNSSGQVTEDQIALANEEKLNNV